MSILSDLVNGKRVALVGNALVDGACSHEIDSHDVVIRLNTMYNYPSGNVGKRIDILVITPTDKTATQWSQGPLDWVAEYKPLIVFVKHPGRGNWHFSKTAFSGLNVEYHDGGMDDYTTGTLILYKLLTDCNPRQLSVYGYSQDSDGFEDYIRGTNPNYLRYLPYEQRLRGAMFKWVDTGLLPPKRRLRVVIPVRGGSSLKDKNIREYKGIPLLELAISKCKNVFGEVEVFTDSLKYSNLAEGWGADVGELDINRGDEEGIQDTMLRWLDGRDDCDFVLLVQATSPRLSETSLRYIKMLFTLGVFPLITVVMENHKASSFFVGDALGIMTSISGVDPTIPRQQLSQCYRFTGGATLFSVVDFRRSGVMIGVEHVEGVLIPEHEGLDIDRIEDFK